MQIKPNVFELESIVDRKLKDINDIVDAVKEIKDGATLIAVSMGKEGALFFKEGKIPICRDFSHTAQALLVQVMP